VFKHLHAHIEREAGKLLKYVRVDNGGEYRGLFKHYYKENDINLEKTFSKTP